MCSPHQHHNAALPFLANSKLCKAHRKAHHDIFINYRVRTEGSRAPFSVAVCCFLLYLFVHIKDKIFHVQMSVFSQTKQKNVYINMYQDQKNVDNVSIFFFFLFMIYLKQILFLNLHSYGKIVMKVILHTLHTKINLFHHAISSH